VLAGMPDPDSPFRCQGKRRTGPKKGDRCPHWASKGRKFCKVHGGHNGGGYSARNIFVRGLSKRLKDVLEEYEDAGDERLSLAVEVDVARVLCERSLALFDATHFGDKEYDVELKAASRANLRESLSHVASLVEKYAKIIALEKNSYSPEHVDQIVSQITRILARYLVPTHQEIFDSIKTELNDMVIVDAPKVSINIGG